MRNTNIELYLKYSNNTNEYEEIYQRSFSELLHEIESEMFILSLNDLIELYIYYSRPNKLKDGYMNNLLSVIYEVISERLSQFKLIDVIDNYIELCNTLIVLNNNIQSNQNIIQIRTDNIKDEFFMNSQALRNHKSIETFKRKYQLEIDSFKNTLDITKSSYNYLEKLKINIKEYIDNMINDLNSEEKKELIQELNKRIDVHSQKLLRQERVLSNKKIFDIEMRLNDMKYEFDFNLKNRLAIYVDCRNTLVSKTKKSGI